MKRPYDGVCLSWRRLALLLVAGVLVYLVLLFVTRQHHMAALVAMALVIGVLTPWTLVRPSSTRRK